jgi:uroporphyrinogen decarboxylase
MPITHKERVIAQINHRETDFIPYTIRFDIGVEDRLDAYYGSSAWRSLIDSAIYRMSGPRLSILEEATSDTYADPYGTLWRLDLRPFHLEEPALKEPSLKGYQFPDVDTLFAPNWKQRVLQDIEQHKNHFVVIGFGFGLWERAWALRGFDNALMDTAAEPAFFEELIEQIANHQLQIVERLLELPVDGIMFSDDWGYQRGVLIGPERWRKIMKPRLAKMYARVHQAGKYTLSHCCGSVVEILPDIIEIGLDVLESIQPEAKGMDPYALKRQFGARIAFWGGLGSQTIIPFGKPDEIRAEINKLCREMSEGGGYILAPAKPLLPETPTENAAAVIESFLRQVGIAFP